ncbi:cupin domain-containing protein [Roseococcus sp. YIM B11640]|uniref:cupin domain-containing protein n=1 Tax=Roseococcus sp. YIM B11640 TaxID=3133973 RepID=UPI003C7CC1F7
MDQHSKGTGLAEAAFALAFEGMEVEEVLALRETPHWKLIRSADRARYERLLSTAVLDRHLRTDGTRSLRISMADDSRNGSAAVPEHEYTMPDGRIDLPNLLMRFDEGASLVLAQFHESHPPLADFCRGLERLFLHPVQANIYLTPPGAQGFRTHYDTHDVLVMQVEGRKRWRVWDGEPVERPTRNTPWPGKLKPEGEPHEFVMEPGDALYIPRGLMHDAATEHGEPSLHITVGFMEASWAQALRNLIDEMEQRDPRLRDSVPTWRIGEADLQPELARRLDRLGGASEAGRLTSLLLEQLARDRQPLPARGLFAPMPQSPLRLTEGMHTHLIQGDDGSATLFWSGGAMNLSPEEAEILAAFSEGAEPGGSDFAQRLWRMGLLERA